MKKEATKRRMNRGLQWFYFISGLLCLLYYVAIGLFRRFGMSMTGIWIVGGIVCLLAGCSAWIHLPKPIRLLFRAGLATGIAFVLVLLCPIIAHMDDKAPQNLDYILVLGARVDPNGPSLALLHRIESAEEYLKLNPDTICIASGGQGNDETISEAQCIFEELVKRGIAPERILTESESKSTDQNFSYSAKLLSSTDASVGVLTNNYHVFRALQIAKREGLTNTYGIAASFVGISKPHYMIREAFALASFYVFGRSAPRSIA